jgi:FO synthase
MGFVSAIADTQKIPRQPVFDNANAAEISRLLAPLPLPALLQQARKITFAGFGPRVTYSRKVFIPLTKLCRDVCHYCIFAQPPKPNVPAYLTADEILAIARAGLAAGCKEALFTLGDQPETRYAAARSTLTTLGHPTTLSYLREMAALVLTETGLLPHLNPGLMTAQDLASLRPVAASMGIMLETASDRLSALGHPHHGSPDKIPARRLATIEAAGVARIPFTTGLLIGIGETRAERVEALVALRDIHRRHGHIQEIIIQNFAPKPGTKMAAHPAPSLEDQCWTIAAARLIFGPSMTIQAPPNLQQDHLAALLDAGVNDWGGVSPITPDHVNPEAPWPHLDALAATTTATGRLLVERLAIGPKFAQAPGVWLDKQLATRVRRLVDARGLPILDGWRPGTNGPVPPHPPARGEISKPIASIITRATAGLRLSEQDIVTLFEADGPDIAAITQAADALRARTAGGTITYVINRNINYTNICLYKCGFCAFSKGSTRDTRGPAYKIDFSEISRRAVEAEARGATEICLQGGIHPDYDGNTYLEILRTVREATPTMHIHAFSPLEITHGAATLNLPLKTYLKKLAAAGLSTLPGTAAEILHDDIRALICPDKITTAQWLDVMRTAHHIGLKSTATIMFGHVDSYHHWATHLLAIRDLQEDTGGFTEFVPLPFVHMEAPIWRKGFSRSGPSWRETILMHAIARLTLNPLIPNIQASWVKLGESGAVAALHAGVNDLGGVLMDESITRAAGGQNGQACDPARMHQLAALAGRAAAQRSTLYQREAVLF